LKSTPKRFRIESIRFGGTKSTDMKPSVYVIRADYDRIYIVENMTQSN
jgi:hypothetical protein